MALVAYDNSDSSEYEEDESEDTAIVTLNTKQQEEQKPTSSKAVSVDETPQESPLTSDQSLFNLLPQPTNKKPVVVEEDDEFLHKKESANVVKPKAKISVPSLDDFKDVAGTAPSVKPKATNGKKSGLLSMLPQPKNGVLTTKVTTKTMIPHVLTKKPETTAKKKPLPSPIDKKKTEKKLANYSDDSDNDDDVQNDFFSINKPVELPAFEDVPLDLEPSQNITASSNKRPRNIESYFKQNTVENHVELEPDAEGTSKEYESEGSSYSSEQVGKTSGNADVGLDDEAILKLCGARGKRKREEIQIVDINQQEVLAEARAMLLKGLMDDTTKRVSASKKKGNEPTGQQRRKHQITYLAHQAKANEAELQNQWANNRMSRRQTQSKYGF